MAKVGTITFTGESGNEYDFDIYPIDTTWRDGIGAVYVVTYRYKKENGKFYHTRIYIGQTDDLKGRLEDHHQIECIQNHDANCVCIHLDADEKSRVKKETDLIRGNSTKCNDT